MILKITKFDDPIWKEDFEPVNLDPKKPLPRELAREVKDMDDTLVFSGGVGIAAPQAGIAKNIFIVSLPNYHEVFINPKITKYSTETDVMEEGCLSIPGYRGLVPRSLEVVIEYTTAEGEKRTQTATGFLARVLQHEMDHLDKTFYPNRIKEEKDFYEIVPIKIVYFGSPDFSATILQNLIGQGTAGDYQVQLVVTQPDKPGHRNQLTSSAVKKIAEKFEIPHISPVSLKKDPSLITQIKKLKPDVLVVASYGKILPPELLQIPRKGAINVHGSMLPKYRGASPIQTAIAEGETETGVTIMLMNEKMDEGEILASAKIKIKDTDTFETLSSRMAPLAADLLNQVLHVWVWSKRIKPVPQKQDEATYTKILKKEDVFFDLTKPPKNLANLVRAYHPWPGVWTRYEGKILKLLPGGKVQLEGKSPVTLKQFQSGHKDFKLDF
jgi:methionyl-tRNA formyltransferase